ncbi:MAG: hypothetical protein ACK5OQ_03610 [Burkholderiales bacterium]
MKGILVAYPAPRRALAGGVRRQGRWLTFPMNVLIMLGSRGEMAEWLMAADCKSPLYRVRWLESIYLHLFLVVVM